jgi:hypothetical protein
MKTERKKNTRDGREDVKEPLSERRRNAPRERKGEREMKQESERKRERKRGRAREIAGHHLCVILNGISKL